jgi:hypothetical protein
VTCNGRTVRTHAAAEATIGVDCGNDVADRQARQIDDPQLRTWVEALAADPVLSPGSSGRHIGLV